ncbi:MAG: hypothetical protein AABW89_03400 [Nanoarchaeota archaeon]
MSKSSRLVVERTELYVPVGSKEVGYILPAVNGNYGNVGRQIISSGDVVPTGDLTAPFVRDLYLGANRDEPSVADARNLVKNRWLWVFNQNLFVLKDKIGPKGVYVVSDFEATGLSVPLYRGTLERKLKGVKESKGLRVSRDKSVRFVVEGSYSFGEMSPEKLALNVFVIAQYGVEGAKLLAEVAGSLHHRPITSGIDVERQIPMQTVSTLDECGGKLRVGCWGDGLVNRGSRGCAFPVSASD